MKKRLSLILLLSTMFCSAAGKTYWQSFPGANKSGKCFPYAEAVHAALEARGWKSYLIIFNWKDNVGWSAWRGCHAIVLFQVEGAWYITSNELAGRPARRVNTDTFLRMVKQVYPMAYESWFKYQSTNDAHDMPSVN